MAEGARVESIESLGRFRIAMIKFAEAVDVALADAEGEITRTAVWLETEQLAYWQTQIRHRHEAVEKAKEAVRMKKLFKDASGRTPSAVEEEKALKVAQQRLDEAVQKLAATQKYIKVLQREFQLYKGGVQRLSTTLADLVPTGVQTLAGLVDQLHRYVGFGPAETTSTSAAGSGTPAGHAGETGVGSMARAEPEPPPAPSTEQATTPARPSDRVEDSPAEGESTPRTDDEGAREGEQSSSREP